jgi:hypothetical protein
LCEPFSITRTTRPWIDVLVDHHALSLSSPVSAQPLKGFTPSLAKPALHRKMDDLIETARHDIRLL